MIQSENNGNDNIQHMHQTLPPQNFILHDNKPTKTKHTRDYFARRVQSVTRTRTLTIELVAKHKRYYSVHQPAVFVRSFVLSGTQTSKRKSKAMVM